LTRVDLHFLIKFVFVGVSDYIEDFVARINAPLLQRISVTFFNQLLFDISELSQFIGRIENFKVRHRAKVDFHDDVAHICLSPFEDTNDGKTLTFRISCQERVATFVSGGNL
jgi:hypothetical protein